MLSTIITIVIIIYKGFPKLKGWILNLVDNSMGGSTC